LWWKERDTPHENPTDRINNAITNLWTMLKTSSPLFDAFPLEEVVGIVS